MRVVSLQNDEITHIGADMVASNLVSTPRFGAIVGATLLSLALGAGPSRAADIAVGPDRILKTLAAGVAAAVAHDRILLDSGIYLDDTVVVKIPLTIEGAVDGKPYATILRATFPIANRKGILVVRADVTLRHLSFEGAHVKDEDGGNGAGVRVEAANVTVEDCDFSNNQDGILADANKTGSIVITRSTFRGNGRGDGYTHALYVNEVAQLVVRDSTFTGTRAGHDIKSRAFKTTIVGAVLDDGVSGTASYAVDLPNGGVAVLDGVRITQGDKTDNPIMVAFGAEGNLKPLSSLVIKNSHFVHAGDSVRAVAVRNFTPEIAVNMENNVFENVAIKMQNRTVSRVRRVLRECCG